MFTDKQVKALAMVVRTYAREHREDVIGALMLVGVFTILTDKELVELARDIDNLK